MIGGAAGGQGAAGGGEVLGVSRRSIAPTGRDGADADAALPRRTESSGAAQRCSGQAEAAARSFVGSSAPPGGSWTERRRRNSRSCSRSAVWMGRLLRFHPNRAVPASASGHVRHAGCAMSSPSARAPITIHCLRRHRGLSTSLLITQQPPLSNSKSAQVAAVDNQARNQAYIIKAQVVI